MLIIGLEILTEMGARNVGLPSDSQLVIKQLAWEYWCTSIAFALYYIATKKLLKYFKEISLEYASMDENWEADEMEKVAFDMKLSGELLYHFILIKKRNQTYINERGMPEEVLNIDEEIVGN